MHSYRMRRGHPGKSLQDPDQLPSRRYNMMADPNAGMLEMLIHIVRVIV
jgi:hypothetical protein